MPKKKKEEAKNWENRIVGMGQKPAKDFKFHSENFREHTDRQRGAIDAMLGRIGWVTGVIENVRTGNLIDGHLRVSEALKQGEETYVPFIQVDLSSEEERLVLLLFDPIGEMANNNLEDFQKLADSLEIDTPALIEMITDITKNLDIPDFPEFDERVENDVEMIQCPNCGHGFPK